MAGGKDSPPPPCSRGGNETDLSAGWYVVNSDISYTGTVILSGDVHLILADGKTMSIGAQRAYFQMTGLTAGDPNATVREFKLNFGENESAGITTTDLTDKAGAWYDLNGRKVDVGAGPVPARLHKGLYIHNGKKVVIK